MCWAFVVEEVKVAENLHAVKFEILMSKYKTNQKFEFQMSQTLPAFCWFCFRPVATFLVINSFGNSNLD